MPIAISDIEKGKISGCKKGSIEYLHEKAHIDFNNSNLGMNIQYFFQLSELGTIIFTVLAFFINFLKWIALVGILLIFFLFIFEEIWCNYTAAENYKIKKRKYL